MTSNHHAPYDLGYTRATTVSYTHLVAILIIYFILVGIVYGLKAGTIKSSSDVPTIMAKSLEGTTGYIVLVFVIAQFINMFNYTNLGMIIAVKSAAFDRSCF